jgi:hypothetical protein
MDAGDAGGKAGSDAGDAGGSGGADAGDAGGSAGADAGDAGGSAGADAGDAGDAGGASGADAGDAGGAGGAAGNDAGGTGGAPPECMAPKDCALPANECVARTCIAGKCGTDNVALGTKISSQTAGDCKVSECDGAGAIVQANDDTDLPMDANDCTDDVCTAGSPTNPPRTKGTPCSANLFCDGSGACTGCLAPSECPGVDDDCQARKCTSGVCGFTYAISGTPLVVQVTGDCKSKQCDGAGVAIDVNDSADLPNDNVQCTNDLCQNGVPSNPNSPAGTPCTENGGKYCSASGTCVECGLPDNCPGQDTDCQKRTCASNLCGLANVALGTKIPDPSQVQGDCKVKECDGQGVTADVIDNTDLPVDNNACTEDVCTTGVPTNPIKPVGTVCGVNLQCDAAGTCVGCLIAIDCPGANTECKTRKCVSGSCAWDFAPIGTALAQQTVGDCLVSECDGAGNVQEVSDSVDLPVDNNDCTYDVCANGVASNPPKLSGSVCSSAGGTVCNATGLCVQCLQAGTCAGTDTDCHTRTCLSGTCGFANAAQGKPLTQQTAGDCHIAECDGQGGVASAIDNTDKPVDGNLCTDDVCTSGVPSNPPVASGTGCGGVMLCDATGNCVGCLQPSDCLGPDTDCRTRKCTSGVCGFTYTDSGIKVSSQAPKDCKSDVCDGSGGVVTVNDDTDVPADGKQCTTDLCTNGTPSNPPVAPGTACTDNGGVGCNASGSCVPAPVVVSTTPADTASVGAPTTIAVTFSQAMAPTTLTGQIVAGPCSGSLQVSRDDFASCIAFSTSNAVTSSGDTVATLTPAPGLLVNRGYKIRVTTAAAAATTIPLAAVYTHANGFVTTSPNLCAGSIVISQVYGGGGNTGAQFTHDFIELHNRGATSVSVAGWSVQYAAATGTTWAATVLTGSIPAGGYYLVQEIGGTNGAALPAPEASGLINLAATAGKVALVNNSTALSGSCPSGSAVVDLVGYGSSADCFEGAFAPGLSNTTSDVRIEAGCADVNNNAADFKAFAPAPRNGATPIGNCSCVILNESGAVLEPDYCNVQDPIGFSLLTGQLTPSIFGQVYELGTTEAIGASPNVRAQLGYGPFNANPQYQSGWRWLNAPFNVQVGNNDEFKAAFIAPEVGDWAYVYRYSLDSGVSWSVCGSPGAGSNDGMSFEFANMPKMSVY